MTNRIGILKDAFVNAPRQVDIQRAVLITESYKRNEKETEVMKRALALYDILTGIDIEIREHELIAGNHTLFRRGAPLFPEYATDWLSAQMDDFSTRPGDRFQITEEQKKVVYTCLDYWYGKSLRDRVMAEVPRQIKDVLDTGIISNVNYTMSAPGHVVPDYAYLLRTGFSGIIAECEERRAMFEKGSEQYSFYNACIVSSNAIIAFAQRYSLLAEELASKENNPERKKELEIIARNCAAVPKNPASSYWEALQFILFVQLAMQLEGNGLAISIGRLDRNIGFLYDQDISSGRIERERALELMECFYIKLGEIDKIYSNEATRALQGPAHGQTITVGGTDENGMDVTNEVTLLVLDADYDVRLVQPDIAVRIHDGTPDAVLEATSRNVREGINKVKIFNDKVVVNALRRIGVSDADIWNFSFLGCSEPVIDGKTDSWGNSGHINLTKCLELALNDGRCMLTGKQMGVHTEDAAKFSGIEDVKAAYRAQLAYFVRALAEFDNQLDQCQAKYAPLPFYSCVISDCIRGGKEFNSGGAVYNTTSPLGIGPITTGDSLMSIKKIVFEQRLLTMEELLEALKTDFQGKEQVRQMLLNRAPKYGNDIDEADSMSDFAMTAYCDELDKYTNYRNGPFTAGMYYLTANIPHGNNTAATADGRHARTPLNDGGVSPTHGADKRGATAVLRSAGKLSNYRAGHGCVLNQLLHPTVFDSENSLQVFSAYMKSMKDIGTWEAQFNVLTPDDLRDAQKHPEKYRGLVVRVAGYSAYFTALEKEMQDDIIERTVLTTF